MAKKLTVDNKKHIVYCMFDELTEEERNKVVLYKQLGYQVKICDTLKEYNSVRTKRKSLTDEEIQKKLEADKNRLKKYLETKEKEGFFKARALYLADEKQAKEKKENTVAAKSTEEK